MKSFFVSLALVVLAAGSIFAQGTTHTLAANGSQVTLPPLTVSGSRILVSVTYDAARQVYRYEYRVNAAFSNQAPIRAIQIDVSGRVARPQVDASLQENIRRLGNDQPATTIPVGITVPDPSWRGGVGQGGEVFFSAGPSGRILPGTTRNGFVIESKLPPGERNAEIRPAMDSWRTILEPLPEGELIPPADQRIYYVKTKVLAPSDPDLSQLFNGGGQSPAEVNPFLRYVSPTDTRTKLPAGTTSTFVTVVYGTTTDPTTFTATLNGADVRSLFNPSPGMIQAVRIELLPGSNKLQLSIGGKTSSGRNARDTDTLTFLVE